MCPTRCLTKCPPPAGSTVPSWALASLRCSPTGATKPLPPSFRHSSPSSEPAPLGSASSKVLPTASPASPNSFPAVTPTSSNTANRSPSLVTLSPPSPLRPLDSPLSRPRSSPSAPPPGLVAASVHRPKKLFSLPTFPPAPMAAPSASSASWTRSEPSSALSPPSGFSN